ncbi:hypothetical protein [Sphingobacterium suaedae]|uniref:Uncharacterized protein n=1 Tax=Sphingobacterium suaedae TaxID=1686402 RepID=A0ABW5KF61_9SPHI
MTVDGHRVELFSRKDIESDQWNATAGKPLGTKEKPKRSMPV